MALPRALRRTSDTMTLFDLCKWKTVTSFSTSCRIDHSFSVPPERLLEWKASDGWEPLCKFLGVPVPSTPFPRVNDTASVRPLSFTWIQKAHLEVLGLQMQRTMLRVKVVGSVFWAAVLAVVGFGGWYGWQYFASAGVSPGEL